MGIETRPTIICLCGSTRFKQQFIEANFRETMAGKIVLSVGWFSHADSEIYAPTEEEKRMLDEVYLHKIDLADEVLVLNVDDYVGESTAREIAYAKSKGKIIRWLVYPTKHVELPERQEAAVSRLARRE